MRLSHEHHQLLTNLLSRAYALHHEATVHQGRPKGDNGPAELTDEQAQHAIDELLEIVAAALTIAKAIKHHKPTEGE